MTTLTSYGQVPAHRQAELIRGLGQNRKTIVPDDAAIALAKTILDAARSSV